MMADIDGMTIRMLKTEVTQSLYEAVMEYNPSHHKGENLPVECVSLYDAIYSCNKLSEMTGLTPAYSVNGNTNVDDWNYTPHRGNSITVSIKVNKSANGFRLPSIEEWSYAAKGGSDYKYAGSSNYEDVAWCQQNSENHTHPVAQKKANGYGLYDMNGNVWEWTPQPYDSLYDVIGGAYDGNGFDFRTDGAYFAHSTPYKGYIDVGFRVVRTISK